MSQQHTATVSSPADDNGESITSVYVPEDISQTIYMDCDDLIYDWSGPFPDWYERKTGLKINPRHVEHGEMFNSLPHHSFEEIVDLILQFNRSEDFAALPLRDGVREFMEALRAAGRKVHVVSACSTQQQTVQMRVGSLLSDFGDDLITDVTIVDLNKSKFDVLQQLPRGMFLDDSPRHVLDSIAAGHHGVLVGACTNQIVRHRPEYRGIPFVENLRQLIPALPEIDACLPANAP